MNGTWCSNTSHINYPLLSLYIYRTITTSVSEDVANIGMVSDGTKCAQSKICMNHQCVDMSPSDITSCPRGDNNITCSGHGVSTKVPVNCWEWWKIWLIWFYYPNLHHSAFCSAFSHQNTDIQWGKECGILLRRLNQSKNSISFL